MENVGDFQNALNAGAMLGHVKQAGDVPFAVIPADAKIADLDRMLAAPTRKKGTVTLRDTNSFIDFVNAERTENTRIYTTTEPPSFTAVFNDCAGWKDHRAVYSCPLSVEWKAWTAQSGRQMSQEQFAQFIEDNLPDIAEPPAAEMLEISRSLEAKKKVNFASGIRLSNGQNELTYEEEISGTAAKGKLQVPELFTIGVPVFEGDARYAVQARLRYRIGEKGHLSMWYELVRPHKILEDAVKNIRAQVAKQTSVPMFNGSI